MTLVLTELSEVGIAMAADSAITKISGRKIIEVDQKEWSKLIRVPDIRAAISYWGMIGAVTSMRFDHWLENVLKSGHYVDLPSLADHLADALNDACHGKPLKDGQELGIHVGGYYQWSDGQSRPFFFHVHNGHGHFEIAEEKDSHGNIIAIHNNWVSDRRKLFEKHQDYPSPSRSLEQNVMGLKSGYITRNGSFFIYALIWDHLLRALRIINLIPGVAIPRSRTLAGRKGFLHTILEIMVKLYSCSNQGRIIGGSVKSLGIGPDGYIL